MSICLRGIGAFIVICGIIGCIYLVIVTRPYIVMGVTCLFSGIISGLLFFSVAEIIDLLTRIATNQECHCKQLPENDQASSN